MKKITLMLTLVFSVFINAQTFNGTGGAIPDNSCGTAHEFPVTVSGVGVLGAANVLDNIALDITHTWDADLDIYIIAPDGTSVELSTDNGGSGDNYTGTIFSASAATLITSGTAPFTGVYKPEGDLSTLMGIDADGIWILRVCDDGVGDTGTLNSWSISFTVAPTCVEPNLLAASNITPYSVQLDWNDPSGSQFDFEYLILPTGSTAPDNTTSGISTGNLTITDSSLSPATTYDAYVRAYCSTLDQSEWVGPVTFTTNCVAVSDFVQDFEGTTGTNFPTCWSKVGTSGATYPQSSTGISGSRNLYMYSSSTTSRPVVAMVPVNNAADGTHRMKMKVRANYTAGETLELGYLTNPSDATTFVAISSIVTNSTTVAQDFITVPTGMPSGDVVFALRTGTVTYSVLVDDIIWEEIPTVAPSCATNVVAAIDNCGNFATAISWDAVSGAEGYKIVIGTTSGGNDVVDNQDLGVALNYSYEGTLNTTYYFTVIPYNAAGDAVGCLEQSFTTSSNGCYCMPSSTSTSTYIDNFTTTSSSGTNISNVSSGYTTGGYADNSASMSVVAYSGLSFDFNAEIVGGTVGFAIWIDWNNDYNFDSTERVFNTTAYSNGPFTGSIAVPSSVADGNYRMRILTHFNSSNPSDPCASNTRLEAEDYTLTVETASCVPATIGTANIVADCANGQYNIDFDVTSLGDGTPSITDGTNFWSVTLGTVTVGPFTSGSEVSLTLLHGSDNTCDLSLGDFVYTCPPSNDECDNAIALTVNSDLNCGVVTAGTTVSATDSGIEPGIAVTGTPNNDVWFSFEATATSHQIALSNVVAVVGTATDMGMAVFSGSCSSFALVADSDPNSFTVSGLTIGDTYYVSVYGWASGTGTAQTNFDICVGTSPAAPSNDECDNAIALTVNSDLNCGVVTAGTTVSATDSGIEPGIAVTGTPNNDVWFSFEATATSHQIALSNVVAVVGTTTDMGMAVFSGSCSSFALVADSDPNSFTVSGLTIGDTYYVSVYGWASGTGTAQTNFDICVGTSPAAPSNDECDNAIALTVNSDLNCGVVTVGTTVSATDSGIEPGIAVTGTPNNDVWFSFEATATSHQIALSNVVAVVGTSVDMGMAVFSGSCSSFALVADSDPNSFTVSGLTIGDTYYVSVYGWASGTSTAQTNFNICVGTDPALSNSDFGIVDSFKAYPNPVKDILNLEYSSDITEIRVINLLGQEVLVQKANATSTQVNMTNLAAGTYIVNVQVGDTVKTLKVIKQ